jgi:hypothetical protein
MKQATNLLAYAAAFLLCQSCSQTLRLELGEAVPSGQFGFNTGTSMYWCNPNTIAACTAVYAPFAPAILRFPGGVDANYYHLDGPGYGFRLPPSGGSPDQRPGGSSSEDNTKRIDSSDDHAAALDDMSAGSFTHPFDASYPNGENVIGSFIQLAVSSGSPVLFTCNMLDASYEENKAVLDSLLRGGVTLAGIELGNEFYLTRYRAKYPDAQSYIATAKHYTAKLREDFPGIKIGAVAAPSAIMGEHERQYRAYKDWNQALAAEDFYDAYIVHYYIKDTITTHCPGDTITAERLLDAFASYNEALQADLAFWTGPAMDGFRALFPGKKMWLTEWSTTNRYICFGNTQVSNLFFARYQNELATRHSDIVELANHHNWLGRGRHFPMLAPAGTSFAERSSSPLFKLLQPIFSGRSTYALRSPEALIKQHLPPGMAVYGYYQTAAGPEAPAQVLLVVVNHSASAHTFQLPDAQVEINGHAFKPQQGVLKSVHASKLWASLGQPAFYSDQPVQLEPLQMAESAFSGSVTVPGYSACVLKIE